MCYITKNVYTVCAHTRMGGLVECEHQKARNERWEDGSFCLTLLSCRPVEQTKLKYWFCDGCREHYDGCDTMTVEAVLNYWAFKNAHGYSSSVSPKLIAAESVFGSRAPARKDDPKHPRRELMALGKVLPRKPFETPVAWLQRLEEARTLTLELAAKWSAVVGHQRQRRERIGERVVHMQPRISTPMSVYPYAHALSSITELSESQESTANLVPSHHSGASPQVHSETLRKLCGDASSECLPRRSTEAKESETGDQIKQEVATVSEPLASSPLGHEVAQDFCFSHRQPPHPLCQALTSSGNSQWRTSQDNSVVGFEAVTRESVAEASGEAISNTGDGTVAPTEFPGQTGDCTSTLPTGPSQGCGVLTENVEKVQHCQTNDGKFTGVSLNEAPTKHETEEFDQPNMTSHFSVSDIDPDEAAALARVDAVSPISVEVAMDKMKTSSRVSETRLPEEHETAPVTVLEIVAPQPRRSASPPRFVQEYGGAATEDRCETDDSWSEIGSSVGRHVGPSPVMVDLSPEEGERQ